MIPFQLGFKTIQEVERPQGLNFPNETLIFSPWQRPKFPHKTICPGISGKRRQTHLPPSTCKQLLVISFLVQWKCHVVFLTNLKGKLYFTSITWSFYISFQDADYTAAHNTTGSGLTGYSCQPTLSDYTSCCHVHLRSATSCHFLTVNAYTALTVWRGPF